MAEQAEAERLDFTFVGTTNRNLSLDPAEFKGRSVDGVEKEIYGLLRSIAPDVSFFHDDIALAAVALTDDSFTRSEATGV